MQNNADDSWTNHMDYSDTLGSLLFPDLGFEGDAEAGPCQHAVLGVSNSNESINYQIDFNDDLPSRATDFIQELPFANSNRATPPIGDAFDTGFFNQPWIGLKDTLGNTAPNSLNPVALTFPYGNIDSNYNLAVPTAYSGIGLQPVFANGISEPPQPALVAPAPICTVQPEDHSAQDKHECGICKKTFRRNADLVRHFRQLHSQNRPAHFCPVPGCDKSRAPFKGYTRDDKVKEHYRKKHAAAVVVDNMDS